MPEGVVKKWFEEKGFGFITPEARGQDIFVHRRALIGVDALEEGLQVSFEPEYDPNNGKWKAASCSVMGGDPNGMPMPMMPMQGGPCQGKGGGGKGGDGKGKGGKGCGGGGKGKDRDGKGGKPGGCPKGGGPKGGCDKGGGRGGGKGPMGNMGGAMDAMREMGMPGMDHGMDPRGGPKGGGDGGKGQAQMQDQQDAQQLAELLSQAEKVRELPGNWLLCRSPRGHFYYNPVTQRVSIDVPAELSSKSGPPPQQPQQQQQQRQPPPQGPSSQEAYMQQQQAQQMQQQQQQRSPPPSGPGYGPGPGPEDPYESQLQDLLSQAEKVRELPGNWLLCRSPRGHFYYNPVTQRVSIDVPAELASKPEMPGPPPQQQLRQQGPAAGQGAYMQQGHQQQMQQVPYPGDNAPYGAYGGFQDIDDPRGQY